MFYGRVGHGSRAESISQGGVANSERLDMYRGLVF
jgi:hypothetical protein